MSKNKKNGKEKENSKVIKRESVEKLETNDIYRLLDLYFYREFYIYKHLYDSYDKFLDEDINRFLLEGEHVFSESIHSDYVYKHKFVYENIRYKSPTFDNNVDPIFPSDARRNSLTYSVKLIADVTQYLEKGKILSNNTTVRKIGETVKDIPVAFLPLMVRSKYCNLKQHKGIDNKECDFDPGGYFIVNGSEKIVICQDRMVENKPLVFIKKDSSSSSFIIQVNSRSYNSHSLPQSLTVRLKKDNIMMLRVPILNEINVFALFRALGIESDRDIINYCSYNELDRYMVNIIRDSLEACRNEKGEKIQTQEQAYDFLMNKVKVLQRFSEVDPRTRIEQKKMHLKNLLETSFLPHLSGDLRDKGIYLGYMINRLIRVSLKRLPLDDRDSYINKRVDLVGDLMFELFKQQYKKVMNECNKFFNNRTDDMNNPYNIIHQIKPNTVEQGLKASLLTGSWIRRKGVAQMLQRLTYLQTIAFFRRIDAPSGDASTGKLTGPRHLHPSSVPFLCLSGDTEVQMNDGSIKQIKDISNEDIVRSVYNNNLKEEMTKIYNYFKIENKENLLEIKLLNGNTIKCTKDHPLMINDKNGNTFLNASKLKCDDNIISRHMIKYIDDKTITKVIINKNDIPKKYLIQMYDADLIDKEISQSKLEITARLIGLCNTDGNLNIKDNDNYDISFYVGEEQDVFDVIDDIKRLGFGESSVSRSTSEFKYDDGRKVLQTTFRVSKGGSLGLYLNKMGAFVGRKTSQTREVPDWIMNGNKNIKREFLSGFQGGDGCRLNYHSNGNILKLNINDTKQTTIREFENETIDYMKQLSKLFEEFDIKTDVIIKEIKNSNKKEICLKFSKSIENLYNYCSYITYRYCQDKRINSSKVIEYVKYRYFSQQILNKKYEQILELHNKRVSSKEICEKTNLKMAIVKRIIENRFNIPKAKYDGKIKLTIDEFIDKYHIKEDKFKIPIISINEIDPEPVYDFTTHNEAHCFIANGICSSNCPVQTPEHAKVGLTKHMTLVTSLTLMERDTLELVTDYLDDIEEIEEISTIDPRELKYYYKIFFNGDWIGVIKGIDDKLSEIPAIKFYNDLYERKLSGYFNIEMFSVIIDHDEFEIRIYCDSGRLYRPVLRIDNNNILLKKSQINDISLNKTHSNKITHWDDFINKNKKIIEYVCMESQPYLMISDKIENVYDMNDRMISSELFKFKGKEIEVLNRYNENFFLKYTHSEFHPSVLLAEIAVNIPFCDSNQGPRNIFQYSQGRQAMGIYTTNYRDRLDISYILYHPQKPLVSTRCAKYVNTDILSSGENSIVAIATYTGYNQEDSLIMNLTSIERGMFRSTSLKKFLSSISKNQNTSQDDIFTKPDPNKVIGIRHGSYDKLNPSGFVPEETVINNGDIILAKIKPIQQDIKTNSEKAFKDDSEVYKSHAPGVVDRIYTKIYNQDMFETRKMLVRSERIPHIGDKFCSRHGQKGTCGILLKASDMPHTRNGIRPDIIVNPNAIPSRMTIGQLIESLLGKKCALKREEADGTPFEPRNIDEIREELKELGYDEDGREYLYNGMTGERMEVRIFIGPTFYQRLKHMVQDKIHSRSRGPTTTLTRQAPEGRSRDGGLRLGEMERDAVAAHGLSKFLKERLLDNSDAYSTYVCGECGLFAQRANRRNNKKFPTPEDVYFCPQCDNYNNIHKVRIPYAFKLMLQELMSMCIAPRIRIVDN